MKTLKTIFATILLLILTVTSYGQISTTRTIEKGKLVTGTEIYPWNFRERITDSDTLRYFTFEYTDSRYRYAKEICYLYMLDKRQLEQFINDLTLLYYDESGNKLYIDRKYYVMSVINRNQVVIYNEDEEPFCLTKNAIMNLMNQLKEHINILQEREEYDMYLSEQ